MSELLSYTNYRVKLAACNTVNTELCAGEENMAVISFRTEVGNPGKPSPPTTTFIGNNVTTIQWSSHFQLGASEASGWDVRITSKSGHVFPIIEVTEIDFNPYK